MMAINDPTNAVAGPWNRLSGVMDARTGSIQIKVDKEALRALTQEIESIPGAMSRAMPTAINAAVSETKTYLGREFRSRLNVIRKKSIDDRLHKSDPATASNWAAGIWFDLERFTVASFRDVQQTAGGVTWSTGGTSGSLEGGFIHRAFIQKGLTHYQTGKYMDLKQVWRRAGPMGRSAKLVPRYPLFVMRGPSLARAFAVDPGFQTEAETRAIAILEKKVTQQVNRILKTI